MWRPRLSIGHPPPENLVVYRVSRDWPRAKASGWPRMVGRNHLFGTRNVESFACERPNRCVMLNDDMQPGILRRFRPQTFNEVPTLWNVRLAPDWEGFSAPRRLGSPPASLVSDGGDVPVSRRGFPVQLALFPDRYG
jgi:hypothetical protein